MGDRAYVLFRPTDVWLYCHSWGIEIPYIVRDVLRGWKDRWEDAGTLASIVFCAMVERYRRFEFYPISFSLDSTPVLADHPELVVDTETKAISFEEREIQPRGVLWRDSFEAYAGLRDTELRNVLARIKYGGDDVERWTPTKEFK